MNHQIVWVGRDLERSSSATPQTPHRFVSLVCSVWTDSSDQTNGRVRRCWDCPVTMTAVKYPSFKPPSVASVLGTRSIIIFFYQREEVCVPLQSHWISSPWFGDKAEAWPQNTESVLELRDQGLQTLPVQDTHVSRFPTGRASEVGWSEPLHEGFDPGFHRRETSFENLTACPYAYTCRLGEQRVHDHFKSNWCHSINVLLDSVPAAQRCLSSTSEVVEVSSLMTSRILPVFRARWVGVMLLDKIIRNLVIHLASPPCSNSDGEGNLEVLIDISN